MRGERRLFGVSDLRTKEITTLKLYLASSSPRRRELMGYTGIPFEIKVSDADELADGAPDELVRENARRKGRAVAAHCPDDVVLSADTLVYLPDEQTVLGKPRNKEDAVRMLKSMQGKWHEVYTGVCVIGPMGEDVRVDVAKVLFDPLTDETIRQYVDTGEPMDKAGSYALQGVGGMFVRRIEGSYSCVIGLPMATVRDMLMPYSLIF